MDDKHAVNERKYEITQAMGEEIVRHHNAMCKLQGEMLLLQSECDHAFERGVCEYCGLDVTGRGYRPTDVLNGE